MSPPPALRKVARRCGTPHTVRREVRVVISGLHFVGAVDNCMLIPAEATSTEASKLRAWQPLRVERRGRVGDALRQPTRPSRYRLRPSSVMGSPAADRNLALASDASRRC
jgi:hypothetical protein